MASLFLYVVTVWVWGRKGDTLGIQKVNFPLQGEMKNKTERLRTNSNAWLVKLNCVIRIIR